MLKNRFSKCFSLFYFIDSRLRGNDRKVAFDKKANKIVIPGSDQESI